jgi:hypothetical protein
MAELPTMGTGEGTRKKKQKGRSVEEAEEKKQ